MDEFFDHENFEYLCAKICGKCGVVFTESYIRQQHEAVCVYSLNKRRHDFSDQGPTKKLQRGNDQFKESLERMKEKYFAIKKENDKLRPIIIPPKCLNNKRGKRYKPYP